MKSSIWVLLGAISTLLLGCASPLKQNQVHVTYDSEPPGAMIYEGEKAWGTAPVNLINTVNENSLRAGYFDLVDMFAVWPSGAKSRSQSVRVLIGKGPQFFSFSRPSDAPGLDKDLAYVSQLKQIKASQAQANAASSAAFWQAYNALQPKRKSPTYTDCSKVGSSVNCTTW